jgi:hypothetical protein
MSVGYDSTLPYGTVKNSFDSLSSTSSTLGTANVTTLVTGVQYAVPVAGATVTSNGASSLVLNPAGTLATLTVVFPASPVAGQRFSLVSSTIVTALTVSGGTIITTAVPTALAAGTPLRYIYEGTTGKWWAI